MNFVKLLRIINLLLLIIVFNAFHRSAFLPKQFIIIINCQIYKDTCLAVEISENGS